MPDPRRTSRLAYLYELSHIGIEMAAPIGLGALCDVYLNTMPWGTSIGAVVGLVGGLFHLVRLTRREPPDEPGSDA